MINAILAALAPINIIEAAVVVGMCSAVYLLLIGLFG